MSRIIFIGDGHMSELAWKSRPSARWDAKSALLAIVGAERGRADALVFCGDCFDSRRPSPDEFKAMADCLDGSGLRVLHVQGNHDKCRGEGWMSLLGSESLHGRVVDVSGVKLAGVDHSGPDELEAVLGGICDSGPFDVLVLHQALSEAGSREPGCLSKADVPHCARIGMVVGHTHNPMACRDSEGRWVVSPGCTHRRKVDEPPGTYAVLEDGAFSSERVQWGRELLELTAEAAAAREEPAADPPQLARVRGADPRTLAKACNRLAKLGLLVFPQLEAGPGREAVKVSVGELCRLEDAISSFASSPDMAGFLLAACSEGVREVDHRSEVMRSERAELERRLADAQAVRNAGVQSGRP
jgi:DNA repair exonuclease SbcCD nuclease subunit